MEQIDISQLPLRDQIAYYQNKEAQGQLTLEDCKMIVKQMRSGRMSAAQTAASSSKRAVPRRSSDELLDELERL